MTPTLYDGPDEPCTQFGYQHFGSRTKRSGVTICAVCHRPTPYQPTKEEEP